MELIQLNGEKPFGQIVPSAQRYSGITLPTFGKLLIVSLTSAKSVRIFLKSDGSINLNVLVTSTKENWPSAFNTNRH